MYYLIVIIILCYVALECMRIFLVPVMMTKRSTVSSESSSTSGGGSIVADLPSGWRREERGGGGGQGRTPVGMGIRGWKSEVVYISPDNIEHKNVFEMQKKLPDFDFSFFDFRSGKSLRNEARRLKLKQKEILKVRVHDLLKGKLC